MSNTAAPTCVPGRPEDFSGTWRINGAFDWALVQGLGNLHTQEDEMRNEPGIRGRHGCVAPTQEDEMSDTMPDTIYIACNQTGEDRAVFETDASMTGWELLRQRYTVRYVRADTAPEPSDEDAPKFMPDEIWVAEEPDGRRRIAYSDGPGYVRYDKLSHEEQELLQLFELLRRVGREKHVAVDWKMYSDGSENINIDGRLFCFDSLDVAIDIVRARLRPVKPTAEEWYGGFEAFRKDGLGTSAYLEELRKRHEAAENWSAEHGE